MNVSVRWDYGLEPPAACEDERHEEAHCPTCCRCRECRDDHRYRFEDRY